MSALVVRPLPAWYIRRDKPNPIYPKGIPHGIQIAKWRAADGLLMDIQTVGEGVENADHPYTPMRCYDRRYIYTYVTPQSLSTTSSGKLIYAPYPEHSELVPGVSKITQGYLNDPLF